MIGQLVSGWILLSIIASLAFVFWPTDACERLNNATTLIHSTLGVVPFAGETLFRRDMSGSWLDIVDWSHWAHEQAKVYFGQPQCQADVHNIYSSYTETDTASDWLQENDPELYKLLTSESETVDADTPRGDRL